MKKHVTPSTSLSTLISERYTFSIPSYQRGYTWTEKNWAQLIRDINQPDSPNGHYLGTLVLHQTKENGFSVIDGQQRLVTLSILLAAVNSKAEAVGLVTFSVLEDQRFYEDLFRKDVKVLSTRAETRTQKQLAQAKEYFEKVSNKISEQDILKTQFLIFHTDSLREATKIFHSLNTGGVALDRIDILRNLIFRNAIETTYSRHLIPLTEKVFEKIARYVTLPVVNGCDFSDLDANQFVRDHWVLYSPDCPSREHELIEDIELFFKSRPLESRGEIIEAYLHSLEDYIEAFREAHSPYFDRIRLHHSLVDALRARFRLGTIFGFGPYLLAAVHAAIKGGEQEHWADVVTLLENQLLRLRIAKNKSNKGKTAAWDLARAIHRKTEAGEKIDIDDVLLDLWDGLPTEFWDRNEVLLSGYELGPDYPLLEDCFRSKSFYLEYSGIFHYLMFEFEKFLAKDLQAYSPAEYQWLKKRETPTLKKGNLVPFRNLQIEHIHPQKDTSWSNEVHRLGNLTLVTEYMNKGQHRQYDAFSEKAKYYSQMTANSPLQQNVLNIAEDPKLPAWTEEQCARLEDQFIEFVKIRWGSQSECFKKIRALESKKKTRHE